MQEYLSTSQDDTLNFANKFASTLKPSDIIILSGELGSGKTKFTEGILTYFGLENEISSPTFTIVNEYHAKQMNIYHFDLYRLADIDEFYAMGGEEYLSKGLCIIEWGELIEPILPDHYTKIIFHKSSENMEERKLEIIQGGKNENISN